MGGNKKGKRIKGAINYPKQTVKKTLFLWPARSFRKGLEAYFTGLRDAYLVKERIMEV